MWILSVYFPEKVVIMMQMWTSQHKGDITTLNLYIIPLNMSFKITLALFFFLQPYHIASLQVLKTYLFNVAHSVFLQRNSV